MKLERKNAQNREGINSHYLVHPFHCKPFINQNKTTIYSSNNKPLYHDYSTCCRQNHNLVTQPCYLVIMMRYFIIQMNQKYLAKLAIMRA